MGRRSGVDQLTPEVRSWLDRALMDGNFSGYEALEEAMRERGCVLSKSAIHRYGQKIERRFAAIKASTEAARMLTEGAADDQDARSEAVIALVQTELFESIVNLQEASEKDIDPAERLGLLSSAAKNIATLTRASVNLKRFQQDMRAKLEVKLAALEAESKSGKGRSFDAETLRIVREEIYGIV
jgi:hypothetical protein